MNIVLHDNGYGKHAQLLKRKITERIPAEFTEKGSLTISLFVHSALAAPESYQITTDSDGMVRVTGSDALGLYYGIGKLLHTALWNEQSFVPHPPTGIQTPKSSFRAIYFSVHNYNWYHLAPTEDLIEYLEEMLLWGYNAIHCIVPVMNITTVGDVVFRDSVDRARRLYTLARSVGLRTSLGINPNQGLLGSPHELDADQTVLRWRAGRNLCPSKPGAVAHLREIWRAKFEQFLDIGIDYIHMWPYDEGGCCCDQCWPWGAKGYGNICLEVYREAIKYYPNAKYIVGTWCFDVQKKDENDPREFEGLYRRLTGDMACFDYIMVDAHGDFPQYVLDHDAVKPVVNFPEISMWGLYPWGGFGSNPLPKRFQRIWDSAKHVLLGGMPYSEGIYEDILKIQCVGYYWKPDAHYRDILAEYIRYYYAADVVPEVLEIMERIEENHEAVENGRKPDLAVAHRAKALAESVDSRLSVAARRAWRWRILYIRTLLDVMRYERYCKDGLGDGANDAWNLKRRSGRLLADNAEAQKLFRELCQLYHCVDYNGQNRWTHPPTDGGDPVDVLR